MARLEVDPGVARRRTTMREPYLTQERSDRGLGGLMQGSYAGFTSDDLAGIECEAAKIELQGARLPEAALLFSCR
ncbi:MAG: hypothetical protein ACK5MQ_18345 [Pikeienuella sp.]